MSSNKKNNAKLIIITGTTACGKTSMAVKLADDINGEIISADSRQIYRGMDIGTGKDLEGYKINGKIIPYHLIDIIDPMDNYSVHDFQKNFFQSFNRINNKNKISIICGGTGLYIESILLDYDLSKKPPPDKPLRDKLSSYNKGKLLDIISEISNPEEIDKMLLITKKQIIRNIEIKKNSKQLSGFSLKPLNDSALIIGLNIEREFLRQKIKIRLEERMNNGMIEEVETLIKNGMPIDRLDYFGLEYRFIGEYLKGITTKDQMFELLKTSIRKFAKRQRTWFRRMEKRGVDIQWVNYDDYDTVFNLSKNYIDES